MMFASSSSSQRKASNSYGRRASIHYHANNAKRTHLDQENSLMSKPILEQNEWIRNELKNYFSEDEADYFVNPSRNISTSKTAAAATTDPKAAASASTGTGNPQHVIAKRTKAALAQHHSATATTTTGLYAQKIWEGLRDDSGDRLKPFDLDKELQKMNYYDFNRAKETMDKFLRNGIREQNEAAMSLSKNNPEMDKLKSVADMTRIKKARKYRNEIELMYRSSKLNEEKVNVLRSNSPLPDLNDLEGKSSIVQYLPPINLTTITRRERADSNLEFANSISQQIKLRNRLKEMNRTSYRSLEMPPIETSGSELSLIESHRPPNQQIRFGTQTLQLKFLDERPYSDYLAWNLGSSADQAAAAKQSGGQRNGDTANTTMTDEAEYLSTVRHNEVTTQRLGEIAEETSSMNDSRSLVLYDENAIVRYPPLSMNALMEYRPQLIAPGTGPFKQGRVGLFETK